MGIAYHAREEFDKAIKHYRAALFTKPSDTNLRQKLATILMEKENAKSALEKAQNAEKSITKLKPIKKNDNNEDKNVKQLNKLLLGGMNKNKTPGNNNKTGKPKYLPCLEMVVVVVVERKRNQDFSIHSVVQRKIMKFDANKQKQTWKFEEKGFVIPQDKFNGTRNSNKQFNEIFEYREFSADELVGKNAAIAKYQLGIQFQDEHKIPEAIEVYRAAVSILHESYSFFL